MLKNLKIFILTLLLSFCFYNGTFAVTNINSEERTDAFAGQAGLLAPSHTTIIENIVKVSLSLLAVVFLILIIYSGFEWMTAGGSEEKVKKAKGRIKNATIGVIIVLFSYIITSFIFSTIECSTTGCNEGVWNFNF